MLNKSLKESTYEDILYRIQQAKKELYHIIDFNKENLTSKEVIEMSQYLDKLLVIHTNKIIQNKGNISKEVD